MSGPGNESNPSERDERLGEAIEVYLALAESGDAPDPDAYAAQHPDLGGDLRAALDGLAMVQGLVGDSRSSPGSLEAGRRVAGYRIVRELGRGGMGIVYEAVHVDLDRPVALKVLGHEAAPDSRGRRRFLNEAKTAAGLHHTHIVPVFDVGQVGGLCYYAMQRIEGSGLDRVVKHLKRVRGSASGPDRSAPRGRAITSWFHPPDSEIGANGALPHHSIHDRPSLTDATASWVSGASATGRRAGLAVATDATVVPFDPPKGSAYHRWVAQVGRQAADGLAYAHRRGVIHRDIKPSNLLVDGRGNAWIADFGLARRASDPGLSQSHAAGPVGTPRYMSPEQASGTPVDPRSDIYSLGATLYELLTLRPPYDGQTSSEVIEQIRRKDAVAPRRIDPRIPRDLETIALKAMAKRPGDRYESAEALADDLARFQALEPVKARRIGPVGRFIRFAHRHPFSTAISVAAGAIVLAVATWAYVSVLFERNMALAAEKRTQEALGRTTEAIRRSEAARAQQLWRESTVIRLSALPERRRQGLNRLRESASLTADHDLQARLREEAVAFLALRDLEPQPPVPTGPTWGAVFVPDAETPSLATLDEEGETVSIVRLSDPAAPYRIGLRTGDLDAGRKPAPIRFGPRDSPRLGTGITSAGSLLAVVWPNGRGIRRLLARTGARYDDLEMPGRHIDSLLATPDGRRLITLERIGEPRGGGMGRPVPPLRVVLWDGSGTARPIATLAEPAPPDEPERPVRFFEIPLVAVGPESCTIAVAWFSFGAADTANPANTITLFDAETGKESGQVPGVPGTIAAVALGPDQLLAAALTDGSIRMWEGSAHTPLPGLYHHLPSVRTLRFNSDGSLLALAGNGTGIEVWDVATNTLVAALQAPAPVADLRFSPEGTTLAAATSTVTALWQIVEPVGRSVLSGFNGRVTSLAFGKKGTLAVAEWTGQTRLWSPAEGPCTGRSLGNPRRHGMLVFDDEGHLQSIDPEGLDRRPFDVVSSDGFLRFSDARPARESGSEAPGSLRVLSALPAPVLVGGAGIAIQGTLLDALRRTQMHRFPFWIAVSQVDSGRRLAAARGSEVYLWDAHEPNTLLRVQPPDPGDLQESGDPGARRRIRDRNGPIGPPGPGGPGAPGGLGGPRGGPGGGQRGGPMWTALALDPRGTALYLLDNESRLHAWTLAETADGLITAKVLPWTTTERGISSLALSPDGQTLACGTEDGLVRFLDPRSGQERGSLPRVDGEARGRITALAYATVGHMLAVGDQQGTLDLWSVEEDSSHPSRSAPKALATRILRFPAHVGSVGPIAFDREGLRLASTADDKLVQVWELDRIERSLENLQLGWTDAASGNHEAGR
jgi:serine/threonine protein kinase/WD40 repeat protein